MRKCNAVVRKALAAIVVLWMSCFPLADGFCAQASREAGRAPLAAKVEAFKAALKAGGFTVEEWPGSFAWVNVGDLVCKGLLEEGFGNNVGAPYLAYTEERGTPPRTVRVPMEFQLNPYEAIVLIGQTPPPVAYFSYRSYVFNHFYEDFNPETRLLELQPLP